MRSASPWVTDVVAAVLPEEVAAVLPEEVADAVAEDVAVAEEVADAVAEDVAGAAADVAAAVAEEVDVETPVRNSGAPKMTRATTDRGRLVPMLTCSIGKPSSSPAAEERLRLTCALQGRIATGGSGS